MYNGYNTVFLNNKEVNSIQQLPNDDLFISNSIQIPRQFTKFLEEGSSSNEDEPDASVIHSISSDNDENSHSSSEKEKKEIDSIFDFENIELPKEEEHGEFTILSDFKFESLESKNKNENNNKNEKNEKNENEKKKEKKEKKEKKKKNEIIQKGIKAQKDIKDKKSKIINAKIEEESEEDEDEEDMKLEAWDLLKLLILTKSKKKTSFMGNFKHLISSIIYYKSFNDKLNKNNVKYPINIFDSKAINFLDLNYSSSSFLYMSYRSGFFNMKYFGMGDFTSDSGWGCMLRCCQMMLSRGLMKIKLKEYYENNEKNIINNQIPKKVIIDIKKDILTLFYDGKLSYNKIRSNLFLTHIFQLYQELADIKGINTNISEMIPPYSIYTLCYLGKCQGMYTSDVRMIKSFLRINELLFNSINMVHFENGHVKKSTLFENFLFFKDDINNKGINCKNIKIYKYYGREFIFNQSGLVFISFRLGLHKLDESYYNIIPIIFSKIHNNIGFVSGKKNRAYYFVGCNGDEKLIFADPHFNQKVEEYNENLFSYNIPELYLLNRSELSGELTLGIAIYNLDDFKILVEDLEYLTKAFPNFITFK